MRFLDHLTLRYLNLYKQYAWVDSLNEIITFPLYNIVGELTGYQRYDWLAPKKDKYFSRVTKGKVGLFGLDTLEHDDNNVIFITEGIWDAIAIQNLGYNAVAVLANNPKHLIETLKQIKAKYSSLLVAVCDGDSAGIRLAKYGDLAVVMNSGEDPSSLDQDELEAILSQYIDINKEIESTNRRLFTKLVNEEVKLLGNLNE